SNSSFEALDDRARFFKAGWARNLHANVLLDIPFLRLHTLNGYGQQDSSFKDKLRREPGAAYSYQKSL
ncbi:MAG: hypothetical protein AB7F31_07595, partial [Parachlamydiales bacterium]